MTAWGHFTFVVNTRYPLDHVTNILFMFIFFETEGPYNCAGHDLHWELGTNSESKNVFSCSSWKYYVFMCTAHVLHNGRADRKIIKNEYEPPKPRSTKLPRSCRWATAVKNLTLQKKFISWVGLLAKNVDITTLERMKENGKYTKKNRENIC